MRQATKRPTAKVQASIAASLVSAIIIIVAWIAKLYGVNIPDEVLGAFGLVLMLVAPPATAYITRPSPLDVPVADTSES